MTPNFALLLSSDGLVLLQRQDDAWARVGEASLEAEDLNAEMAALRAIAAKLSDDEIRTKLILPDDQIRFLTIETARTTQEDIEAAVLAATPMTLDEIRLDFGRFGGRTYIAAVARQTLLEAETFAQEHGFAPVSFTALAEPYTFTSEVSFGPTVFAQDSYGIDEDIARDDDEPLRAALRDTSDGPDFSIALTDISEDAAETPDTADQADEEQPVFIARPRENETTVAESAVETPAITFKRREPADAPSEAPKVEAPTSVIANLKPTAPETRKAEPKAAKTGALLAARRTQSRTEATADMALSRGLGANKASKSRSVGGLALAAGVAALVVGAGIWATRSVDGNLGELLTLDPGLQEDPLAAAPAQVAVVEQPAPVVEEAPAAAPETPVVATVDETEQAAPIVTAIPGRVLSPADAARIYAATGVWQRAPRLPDRDVDEQGTLEGLHSFATLPAADRLPRPTGPENASLKHELQMIAPLNPAPINQPRPRDEDGFILAAQTGTVLPTGVTIYARAPAARPPLRPTDERVYLRDDSIPQVLTDGISPIAFANFTVDSKVPAARAFIAPVLSQPDPVVVPKFVQAPTLEEKIAIITEPAEPLPPEAGPEILSELQDTASTITPELPTAEQLVGRTFGAVSEIDDSLNQRVPEAVSAVTADQPLAPPPLDDANAPLGFVEVIFGRPAIEPPLRPTPEAAAPVDTATADETLPQTDTDTAIAEQTPEVAEAADIPALASAVEEALEEALPVPAVAQDPALAGFRPLVRPASLAPTSLITFEAIPALAGARPSLRPNGLAPLPEPEPEPIAAPVADPAAPNNDNITAIVAAIAEAAPPSLIVAPTAQAIAVSPRPDARPRNFARVVASAQTLTNRQQTRDAAAATSAAVVQQAPRSAPVTGGQTGVTVARAATVDNAIRLRDMNLIGVYGKPGARRALIRMPNGRFVKVEVGSRLDGGRVTAIGDSALNFVKRGQTYALQLPAG